MPLFETNKSDFFILLRKLLSENSTTYKKIYLSFGSKYNEPEVIYTSSIIPNRRTNAPFQMIPAFLRDYEFPDRILSICIDDFSDEKTKESNRKILNPVIQDTIDMVLVDWRVSIDDLEIGLLRFIKIIDQMKIDPHRIYSALYFQFIHANDAEDIFADKSSDCARTVFKTTIYRNSLYLWYGYNPNLYNCICPAYYSLTNYQHNLTIIRKKFGYIPIDSYDIEYWISSLEPTVKPQIRTFMTNCYDITQYSNDGNFWPIYRPYLMDEDSTV